MRLLRHAKSLKRHRRVSPCGCPTPEIRSTRTVVARASCLRNMLRYSKAGTLMTTPVCECVFGSFFRLPPQWHHVDTRSDDDREIRIPFGRPQSPKNCDLLQPNAVASECPVQAQTIDGGSSDMTCHIPQRRIVISCCRRSCAPTLGAKTSSLVLGDTGMRPTPGPNTYTHVLTHTYT